MTQTRKYTGIDVFVSSGPHIQAEFKRFKEPYYDTIITQLVVFRFLKCMFSLAFNSFCITTGTYH